MKKSASGRQYKCRILLAQTPVFFYFFEPRASWASINIVTEPLKSIALKRQRVLDFCVYRTSLLQNFNTYNEASRSRSPMTRAIGKRPEPDRIEASKRVETSVAAALLSIILPPVCTLCNESLINEVLCPACYEEFEQERLSGPCCPTCSEPYVSQSASDHLCIHCTSCAPPFIEARSLYLYKGTVLEAIHRLKYSGDTTISHPLGRLLSQDIKKMNISPIALLPIPLYRNRLRKRSFNQSLLLAREAARALSVPLDFRGLVRIRDTGPQVGLNRAERALNMKGAFKLLNPDMYKGKCLLLVDDVYTTGATMRECAALLRDAGAIPYGITLARAAKIT